MSVTNQSDTIIALATPQGVSAIAVIRLSGEDAIEVVNRVFVGSDLTRQPTHTLHLGMIIDGSSEIDEVMVSVFKAPKSYTMENSVEISCHGSMYIVRRIIEVLIKAGARLAKAGEYTQRAFLNGRFDLAQAEAVADIILADNESARKAALTQMRGGFSTEIEQLRQELVHFSSMIELELDFSEEDVEFASRNELEVLIRNLQEKIQSLLASFSIGNVIKNGVPTVIAGKPNAGKSTLLNALLKEDRAIVSDIPGTTRDTVEDELVLHGIVFRFIDTAGLRDTTDIIESIGVERTRKELEKASLILFVFDLATEHPTEIQKKINELDKQAVPYLAIGNKADLVDQQVRSSFGQYENGMILSATQPDDLRNLEEAILDKINAKNFNTGDTLVTNLRHYEQLNQTYEALGSVLRGLENKVSHDFIAQDIRHALHHLGEITGQITTDDLLENIFSKFCIGK